MQNLVHNWKTSKNANSSYNPYDNFTHLAINTQFLKNFLKSLWIINGMIYSIKE